MGLLMLNERVYKRAENIESAYFQKNMCLLLLSSTSFIAIIIIYRLHYILVGSTRKGNMPILFITVSSGLKVFGTKKVPNKYWRNE